MASLKTYFIIYSSPAFSTNREGAKGVFRDANYYSISLKAPHLKGSLYFFIISS